MEFSGSFRVGVWQVESQQNLLKQGERSVRLEPKVMDVLCYLALHNGEVLTKERILEAVWPDTFVGDESLTRTIVVLRRALGDDARSARYIETIAKRGYRMVADVSFSEAPPRQVESPASPASGTSETLRSGRVIRLLRPDQEPETERKPFPGLAPFTEADSELFFGREAEIADLWERIERRNLLAVIGPSGAGKTSFLRAGVILARPAGWATAYATPGSSPALGLVRSLATELASDPVAMEELLAGLAELKPPAVPHRLTAAIGGWRRLHREVLLVVDQFEELFTLNPPEVQIQFAALLGTMVNDIGLHVVLSLRDDFLIRCSEHSALAPVFDSLTPLPPLRQAALRRALEEPAARQGYRFEDEALVMEIVSEVEGERGSLPLLAFAVSRLWDRRDRVAHVLTRQGYLDIGGVEGALARHAELTLERIPAIHHGVVREIFRNLVTSKGTRAAMEREELLSVFEDRGIAAEVLRLLVNARLLTTFQGDGNDRQQGNPQIELVHESLLETWPRLVRWQAQDQEGAQLRDEIRQAARTWNQHGRSPDLLWTGTAQQECLLWRQRYPGSLAKLEEEFLESMTRRAHRKTRLVRYLVASVILGLAAVAGFIGISHQQALEAARRAEASKLLAIAELRMQEDPTEALAYTTASLELNDSKEGRLLTARALAEAPPAIELAHGFGQNMQVPAFSPDGRLMALGGFSSEVGIWRDDGTLLLRLANHPVTPNAPVIAHWLSNDFVATGWADDRTERVFVWAVPEGRQILTLDFGGPSRWSVGSNLVFSETLFSKADGATSLELNAWPIPSGNPVRLGQVQLSGPRPEVSFVTFDAGGWIHSEGQSLWLKPLPVGSGNDLLLRRHESPVVDGGIFPGPWRYWIRDAGGSVRTWSFEHGRPSAVEEHSKPDADTSTIHPDPSGEWLATQGWEGSNVRIWRTEGPRGAVPGVLRRRASWFSSVCRFSPAGDWLACPTGAMYRLTLWPLSHLKTTVVPGQLSPVAFSPDSRWVATKGKDFRLRLWPVPGTGHRDSILLGVPAADWRMVSFDPAGRFLFAVGGRGTAWIAPLDGSEGRRLEGFSQDVLLVACDLSPSGNLATSATAFSETDRSLRVWDLASGRMRTWSLSRDTTGDGAETEFPPGQRDCVSDLVFTSEEEIYTAGNGGIRSWDLESGRQSMVWPARIWARLSSGDPNGPILAYSVEAEVRSPHRSDWIDSRTGRLTPVVDLSQFNGSTPAAVSGSHLLGFGADGLLRLRSAAGGQVHVLAEHLGAEPFSLNNVVAVSPDGKWVASISKDETLRLSPVPDLSAIPLISRPHQQLIQQLKALTNLRAVQDPETDTGWAIELGPFPGWGNPGANP